MMGENRFTKLLELLNSKNRVLKTEAITALTKIPFTNNELISHLYSQLYNQNWDTRIAVADALEEILKTSLLKEEVQSEEENDNENLTFNFFQLKKLDLKSLMEKYQPLLSCNDYAIENISSIKCNSKKEQRKLIDKQLHMYDIGFSSLEFINDEEISLGKCSTTKNNEIKQELKNEVLDNEVSEKKEKLVVIPLKKAFKSFLNNILINLLDPVWQTRHGSALMLAKIICSCPLSFLMDSLEIITIRILQMLSLDRFNDFITGSNAISPVRESAAQALSMLILKVKDYSSEFFQCVFEHLKVLLNMNKPQQWQCRYTALLVLKYYFLICTNSNEYLELFPLVVDAILDCDDEVASRAIIALSAFFSNPKLSNSIKLNLINQVMNVIWKMLLSNKNFSELMEDVNSLLLDLLVIIQIWIKIDEKAAFTNEQIKVLLQFLEPGSIVRSIQTLKCLSLFLKKSTNLLSIKNECFSEENVYFLLKGMFRCILFSSCINVHDSENLFEAIFDTTNKLFNTLGIKFISEMNSIRTIIGSWFACLCYSYRQLELDVFLHGVDGATSVKEYPLEILCGEEIRSLNEEQINEALISRKIIAARFIAIILNAFYQSDAMIDGLPSYIRVQNMFLNYLQSNSLYHRLAAALVINCLARHYHQASLRTQTHVPKILFGELLKHIFNTDSRAYIEVKHSIEILTKETNDFQQYCVKHGVPRSELLCIEQATTMEQVALAAYENLKKRLTRQGDLDSLEIRYNVVLDFIRSARISFRTNTARVDALLISAFLYYNFQPQTLTPIVKPLIDATSFEENVHVIEEIFDDFFILIIQLSSQRSNCSLIKILRSLWHGLSSCENFAPSLKNWENPEKSLSIILLEKETSDNIINTRSKNTQKIIERLCEHYGTDLFKICKEIKMFILITSDVEAFVNNLNMLIVIFPCLALKYSNIKEFFLNTTESSNKQKNNKDNEVESNYVFVSQLLIEHLAHSNPAIRYRVAKFLSTFASINLTEVLNTFYFKIKNLLANFNNDTGICGAVELLLFLSKLEHKVLGAVSMLASLALKEISNPLESVRNAAALAFGRFVALLPLENHNDCFLQNLNEKLIIEFENNKNFANVLSSPENLPKILSNEIPGLSDKKILREYQLEGITWIRYLNKFNLNGILADDMGLGKTLQVLCVLAIELVEMKKNSNCDNDILPTLILCPKTLKNHWCKEWEKFFPNEKPFVKFDNLPVDIVRTIKKLENNFVMVLSYDELRNLSNLNEIRWNYVILDEGHCVRNSESLLYKLVASLISKHRLILSGTPVQNSPADLWSLFSFLMPGYLSSKSNFNLLYMKKILACRNPKATEKKIKEGEATLKKLHHRILPFILRRLKTEVLKELPEKIIQDYVCQLTNFQKKLYQIIVDHCNFVKKNEEKIDENFSPLHTLILLRKLVDHPFLIAKNIAPFLKDDLEQQKLTSMQFELSGKMMALKELLEECQIGNMNVEEMANDEEIDFDQILTNAATPRQRALIFCQWKASVDLIVHFIETEQFGNNITYLRLDGTVPVNVRQTIVDKFNNDVSIDLLILTTHVGGVGLTLTGANVIIFVDHDWNPIKDLQAIDRAHRLGQTRTVNVYRLITQNSVEEKVMHLQQFKVNTANALVGANNVLSSMGASNLKDLLSLNDKSYINENSEPLIKKSKISENKDLEDIETKYSLETLWDSSQYDEEHSMENFLEKTNKIV